MNSPRYVALPARLRRWLDSLSLEDRIVWVAAMFGGSRPGELRPLRWSETSRDEIGGAR